MTAQELKQAYANGERNFFGSDLQGADLRGAYLQGADLRGANLQGADLWGANLQGADLWGANLQGANLWGANLQEANLWEANLQDAKGYFSFFAYGTSGRLVHCVRHESGWMVKAGCFWGTLDELEAKVLQVHGEEKGKVYLTQIELLKTL